MVREKQAERERGSSSPHRDPRPLDGTAVNVKLQKGEQIKAATTLFALVSHTQPGGGQLQGDRAHPRQEGLVATVVLDIYPDGVAGGGRGISPATGAEFALLPERVGRWVRWCSACRRVRLLPQPGEPPLRAGMTATVKVGTGHRRRLSNLFGGWTAMATAR
jgi:membrane fusion protein (multidrug efflux system)